MIFKVLFLILQYITVNFFLLLLPRTTNLKSWININSPSPSSVDQNLGTAGLNWVIFSQTETKGWQEGSGERQLPNYLRWLSEFGSLFSSVSFWGHTYLHSVLTAGSVFRYQACQTQRTILLSDSGVLGSKLRSNACTALNFVPWHCGLLFPFLNFQTLKALHILHCIALPSSNQANQSTRFQELSIPLSFFLPFLLIIFLSYIRQE